jgi:hypothetical protein
MQMKPISHDIRFISYNVAQKSKITTAYTLMDFLGKVAPPRPPSAWVICLQECPNDDIGQEFAINLNRELTMFYRSSGVEWYSPYKIWLGKRLDVIARLFKFGIKVIFLTAYGVDVAYKKTTFFNKISHKKGAHFYELSLPLPQPLLFISTLAEY